MESIQRYISLYLYKITTQNAPWQRYINSHLFLGVNRKSIRTLLACAMVEIGVKYGY